MLFFLRYTCYVHATSKSDDIEVPITPLYTVATGVPFVA